MERILTFMLINIVGGGAVAVALALLPLLLPGFMGRCQQLLDTMPGRAFVVGLVNFLFFFTVALVALQIGQAAGGLIGGLFNLMGLAVAWFLLALMGLGTAGLVMLLNGRRTRPGEPFSLRQLSLTSLFLMTALLSPFIGWFILTPILLLTVLGAAIIALVQRRSPTA